MTDLRYRIRGFAALTLALVSLALVPPVLALAQQGEAQAVQDPAAQQATVSPSEPSSSAVFDGFGESWLAFRLLYWVPMEDLLRIKTEMSLAVNDALNAAEVKIAIPRHSVDIRNEG